VCYFDIFMLHVFKNDLIQADNPTAQSVPNITRILIDPDIPEVRLFKDR
jgi:hypothetical protein